MKVSSIILATLALAASASAQAETPATRWCNAFIANCKTAANTVCGMNRQAEWNCKANFNGNVCQSYEIKCNCTPPGGAATSASQVALISTFQATNGGCQNVPLHPGTSTPVTTTPLPTAIGGSLPTSTTAPAPTASKSAGTITRGSALAAAVAAGAVVLAL